MAFSFANGTENFFMTNVNERSPESVPGFGKVLYEYANNLTLYERHHTRAQLRRCILRRIVVHCAASCECRSVVAHNGTNQGLAHLVQTLSKVTVFGQHEVEVAEEMFFLDYGSCRHRALCHQ